MLPDLVHRLLPLSREYQVPLVYEIRGVWEDTEVACGRLQPDSPIYKKRRDAATRAATAADMVITISEGLRQDFVSRGVAADKITVVPNGVDTSFFVPRARDVKLAAQHNLTGKMVFGYISTIRRLEGIEYLVTAMRDIVKFIPNARCLIVGDGDYAPQLRALVDKLGLNNSVILTGRVKHEEILAYYSLIDVFVVPRPNARVNNLVTPLKPLEAMSMAKALLVSGVGGLAELVQDGCTGLIFKPEDVSDLAAKAMVLAQSSELCRRLGEEARRYVVRERDWTDVIGSYQERTLKIAMERLNSRSRSRATA
jgi:glycosyltransferase involved in cell wall biosynthesis